MVQITISVKRPYGGGLGSEDVGVWFDQADDVAAKERVMPLEMLSNKKGDREGVSDGSITVMDLKNDKVLRVAR